MTAGLILALALSGCGRQPAGQRLYGPNCGICHHGGGGLPGEIPPLSHRLTTIAQSQAGRAYLVDVLLNGLMGPITADGKPFNFSMPSFRRLSDEEISLILNWLIDRDTQNPPPRITAAEVALARQKRLSPFAVHEERDALNAQHALP